MFGYRSIPKRLSVNKRNPENQYQNEKHINKGATTPYKTLDQIQKKYVKELERSLTTLIDFTTFNFKKWQRKLQNISKHQLRKYSHSQKQNKYNLQKHKSLEQSRNFDRDREENKNLNKVIKRELRKDV